MVAREGRTPREAIEKAIAILGRQRVLGIVLNAVEESRANVFRILWIWWTIPGRMA